MRFTRRDRSRLLWGRRAKAPAEEEKFRPVASEERSALLSDRANTDQIPQESQPAEEPPADPTQRLLTALGRFQRQIARAREGLPQEAWSDECMFQLITAVEISLSQNWKDLVKTLTEVARVLQSYEDAGQEQFCVPFLSDSYEILCLMVGDLIVGKVRSGVLEKWQRRYNQALEDLATAGIPLIADEEAIEADARKKPSDEAIGEAEAILAELPALGELPPLEEEGAAAVELEEKAVPWPVEEEAEAIPGQERAAAMEEAVGSEPVGSAQESAAGLESLGLEFEQGMGELQPEAAEVEVAAGEEAQIGAFEAKVGETEGVPCETPAAEEPAGAGVTGRRDLPQEVIQALDDLCDALSELALGQPHVLREAQERIEKDLAFLEERAEGVGRAGALVPCRTMERLIRAGCGQTGPLEDRFFELAYGFCGLYAEAGAASDSPAIQNWLAECEEVVRRTEAAAPEPELAEAPVGAEEIQPEQPPEEEAVALAEAAPPGVEELVGVLQAPVPPVEPPPAESAVLEVEPEESGSPQNLLETARRAVCEGRVSKAKLLALQAAARIAEAETQEAEGRLAEVEQRLKTGVAESEAARSKVQDAERMVAEAERGVAEVMQSMEQVEKETGESNSELGTVENVLRDIEAQIRSLEQQREEAERRKAAAATKLEQAQAREAEAKKELDKRRQSEMEARMALEEARQQVKAVERKRMEYETATERAREALDRQRASLADIEEMIAGIGEEKASEGSSGNELLF